MSVKLILELTLDWIWKKFKTVLETQRLPPKYRLSRPQSDCTLNDSENQAELYNYKLNILLKQMRIFIFRTAL